MELGSNTGEKSSSGSEREPDLIIVRASITCPRCDYNKRFKNQFYRRDLELMVVALKVFDWLTCTKCGELLDLNLEYEI
jgi:hypothetical protein